MIYDLQIYDLQIYDLQIYDLQIYLKILLFWLFAMRIG